LDEIIKLNKAKIAKNSELDNTEGEVGFFFCNMCCWEKLACRCQWRHSEL